MDVLRKLGTHSTPDQVIFQFSVVLHPKRLACRVVDADEAVVVC